MNQPYDVSALEAATTSLAITLGQWEGRDDSQPQPEVRQAANTAMDEIDAMLRELYLMRGRLVSEIRASDDATEVRARELLERVRRDRLGGHAAAQTTEGSDGTDAP